MARSHVVDIDHAQRDDGTPHAKRVSDFALREEDAGPSIGIIYSVALGAAFILAVLAIVLIVRIVA